MKEDVYFKCLNVQSFDDVVKKFHETIIETNRDLKFFVDWKKICMNIEKHKIELNIFNSLIGSKNFDFDLKNILLNYPGVIPCIPILIAIRDTNLKVIDDFNSSNPKILKYNFTKRRLSSPELEEFIDFFDNTGLKNFFLNLSSRSIQDYVFGIEVGLDTHARKNRSGQAMELVLRPFFNKIRTQKNILHVLSQKKFSCVEKDFKIPISTSLKNRKFDFVIIDRKHKLTNIEANFFSGTGSKPQEIVDSYINRQNELKEIGFNFIWITDGLGWKGQKNQIRKGFEKIDYLLNLDFIRRGLLEAILCQN
jgi:type II restriction enzyme